MVFVRGSGGDHATAFPAMAVDRARIDRVVSRIVRGLFRSTRGYRLSDAAEIQVVSDPDSVNRQQSQLEVLLRGPNLRNVQERVFWFTHNVAADNPRVSLWLLVFFDEFACIATVREP